MRWASVGLIDIQERNAVLFTQTAGLVMVSWTVGEQFQSDFQLKRSSFYKLLLRATEERQEKHAEGSGGFLLAADGCSGRMTVPSWGFILSS